MLAKLLHKNSSTSLASYNYLFQDILVSCGCVMFAGPDVYLWVEKCVCRSGGKGINWGNELTHMTRGMVYFLMDCSFQFYISTIRSYHDIFSKLCRFNGTYPDFSLTDGRFAILSCSWIMLYVSPWHFSSPYNDLWTHRRWCGF